MIQTIDNNLILKQLKIISRPYRHGTPRLLKKIKQALGYDSGQWARTVMYRELFQFVENLKPSKLDALEISSGRAWQKLGFKSFTEANYPEFDICHDCLSQKFDVIIADQVFEHLLFPYKAGKNVYQMLAPEGYFLITTPFLIRIHNHPVDCTRWTETGLKYFLAECGFELDRIETGSWGNRQCVKANLHPQKWPEQGWFRSLTNEPNYPVAVWAIAKKTGQ